MGNVAKRMRAASLPRVDRLTGWDRQVAPKVVQAQTKRLRSYVSCRVDLFLKPAILLLLLHSCDKMK